MKLYQVDFEYTERGAVPNIIAETPEQAIAGAEKLVKGKVKNPTNFVANEQADEEETKPTIN